MAKLCASSCQDVMAHPLEYNCPATKTYLPPNDFLKTIGEDTHGPGIKRNIWWKPLLAWNLLPWNGPKQQCGVQALKSENLRQKKVASVLGFIGFILGETAGMSKAWLVFATFVTFVSVFISLPFWYKFRTGNDRGAALDTEDGAIEAFKQCQATSRTLWLISLKMLEMFEGLQAPNLTVGESMSQ